MISLQDRRKIDELVKEAQQKGLTVEQACDVLGICSKTYQSWCKHGIDKVDGRLDRSKQNYVNKRRIPDEIRNKIKARFSLKDVRDLSLTQAFYKLLDEKKEYYCSLSTLYRICEKTRRTGDRPPRHSARPMTYHAERPNQVWTWDITYLRTSAYTGRFYYAYVILDVYSRAVIRAKVYDADNAKNARDFLEGAFIKHRIKPGQLVVHSDNGASMKAGSTTGLLKDYGIEFSHSRPRVSNDNPYSESLFRTLKYTGDYQYPAYGFESIEQAQEWIDSFVYHYNEHHRHRGIRMVTPGSRFRGEDATILARRKQTMLEARRKHPDRWIQDVLLNCEPVGSVALNPDNGQVEEAKKATEKKEEA